MSGECNKCGEHALECGCNIDHNSLREMHMSIIIPEGNNTIIQHKISYENLSINFDEINFETITLKRDGKEITFPTWEFWQVLQKHYDDGKVNV